jgi:hypothetical protein
VSDPAEHVLDVLTDVRTVLAGACFPLAVPSAAPATDTSSRLIKQLDDYLLPRLGRLDAPLLAVVGGSTGAGKSTLVNSLVRAPVSAAGVLRPTTRAPLLVSHPNDATWFTERRVLPGLTRSHGVRTDEPTLQVISAPALTPGLALLDAPDIDSVVDGNRDLATQLFAAADLWLFVTTAARYADAVPWRMLRSARDRGTVVVMVLDRVPIGADEEVPAHLRVMLTDQRLGDVDLFVVPEASLDGSGMLSETLIAPLHERLAALASDAVARSRVGRTTLDGAIRALREDIDDLASAADEQADAWQRLDDAVTRWHQDAESEIRTALADGRLLRGDVRARWQEFVGTGDLTRALRVRAGKRRDRTITAMTGRQSTGDDLREGLTAAVAALVAAHATTAGERTAHEWAAMPAGTALATPMLAQPRSGLPDRCDELVRQWQRTVRDLVARDKGTKRRLGRVKAYSVNATAVLVMISVCASTAFDPTGAELTDAGGTSAATRKLLDEVSGDETMRRLASAARDDLMARVHALLEVEAARFGDVRASIELDPTLGERLRRGARSVAEHVSVAQAEAPDVSVEPGTEPAERYVPTKTPTPSPPGSTEPQTWRPIRRDAPASPAVPSTGDQSSGSPNAGSRS